VVAAGVLFFFPIATHLIHPGPRYVGYYRVPIQWTFAVLPSLDPASYPNAVFVFGTTTGNGRLGMTAFTYSLYWGKPEPVALMIFGAEPKSEDANRHLELFSVPGATDTIVRTFSFRSVTVTCLQYRTRRWGDIWPYITDGWSADCTTPPTEHHNFYAHFGGREEELDAFFQIVEHVVPVE
jgi:hypothetical protein